MSCRVVDLVLDAIDLQRQARFWAAALRWEVGTEDGQPVLVPTDGTPLRVLFEPTTERKQGQNTIHLDLTTVSQADQDETVAQLLALGGHHADVGQGPEEDHVVLADPEGNELCILAPGNRFLAGCGRLGAVNCDGTRATGVFWSAALDLPLVWDQDEETAIRLPGPTGPMITWSGPPLMPRHGKNRLHLDLAPTAGTTTDDEVARLVALGARRVDIGQGDVGWAVMADPDGNEFCVLQPR